MNGRMKGSVASYVIADQHICICSKLTSRTMINVKSEDCICVTGLFVTPQIEEYT
jgi:hypothetical protein